MHGREGDCCNFRLERPPAVPRHARATAEQCLGRDCAEADEDARLHHLELALEPGPAGGDLVGVRPLVDPPRAAGRPLEVLDRVGQVGVAALDPGFLERLVEEAPRRTDEGRPSRSSWSPGCSPTRTTRAPFRPSPNTVWVASRQSGHARQSRAASRSDVSERRAGRCSAAVPVFCTVVGIPRFPGLHSRGIVRNGLDGDDWTSRVVKEADMRRILLTCAWRSLRRRRSRRTTAAARGGR